MSSFQSSQSWAIFGPDRIPPRGINDEGGLQYARLIRSVLEGLASRDPLADFLAFNGGGHVLMVWLVGQFVGAADQSGFEAAKACDDYRLNFAQ